MTVERKAVRWVAPPVARLEKQTVARKALPKGYCLVVMKAA